MNGIARTAMRKGVVVSPHFAASEVGAQILREGGTAVDAAVAANAVLAVDYAHSCGLGGDAFALVWDPGTSALHAYNGTGRAPAGLTVDLVRSRGHSGMPQRGPLTVTVPGAVDAWQALIGRFGRKTLRDLLQPAVTRAEEGVPVTTTSAQRIAESVSFFDVAAKRMFLPNGEPPGPGSVLRLPLLAATLATIADGGAKAFYEGLAAEIARAVQEAGGVLTRDDMERHAGAWVTPVETTYHGVRVATVPPNSQGITALIALNVMVALETLGWPNLPALAPVRSESQNAARIHAQVESIKVAWRDRDRFIGDPDRMTQPVTELLTRRHARHLTHDLSPDVAMRYSPTTPPRGGTVYLCAADSAGMVVSLIQSNWMGFGSGVTAGRTGVMLNNRANYFDLESEGPNALAGGARPLHTLSPMVLLNSRSAIGALGAMGGDGQPQFVLQLVNDLVDDRLDPQSAVNRPRWQAVSDGRRVPLKEIVLERGCLDPDQIRKLEERGHDVRVIERTIPSRAVGWAQAVMLNHDDEWTAGADPRADSLAVVE